MSSTETPRGICAWALLGASIGIPAAFVAALFLGVVNELHEWLWVDLPDQLGHTSPPWFLVIGLPVVGASVVLAARMWLPGDGGHPPLEGIGGGTTPIAYAPGVALAAIGTLAFGAVLGPEAPLIALGSVAGLAVTSFARLGPKESEVAGTAGSFAAISAVFGGPIVGGVLMVEAGAPALGASLIPALLPGFVAAAVGYDLFIGFGDWGGLGTPGLAVPDLPLYEGAHLADLLLGLIVGIVAAILIALVHRLAGRVSSTPRLGLPALLLGGGAAVGLTAQLAVVFGADSQDVLFSGQQSVPALVSENSTKIVLILLLAKALAYAISLGCGFRGGPVFPAIFLGVAVAALPVVWFDISPTLAIAMGAAAGMAAATRLLLTPMLFAALLVGHQGLDTVPASVLAAAAAWLTSSALDRRAPAGNS